MNALATKAVARVGWFALVAFSFCSVISLGGQPTPFPGKQPSVLSPDKQYELINRDADSDADASKLGDNHALFLRDVKTGAEKKIHAYARHIEVFWSPDDRFIAVTDFAASDASVCYIFRLAEGKMVNVADALTKALESSGKLKNHHVYFQAVAWQKGPILKVKVSGYGEHDKKGFETSCLYDVAKDQAVLPP